MIRSRIPAVLLSGLFLLQLTVGGGSAAMGMEMAMDTPGTPGAEAMQESMSMASAAEDGPESPTPTPSDESPCSENVPCHVPRIPGGCHAAPCPAAVPAPSVPIGAVLSLEHSERPLPIEIRAPHTRTFLPELPPPRA